MRAVHHLDDQGCLLDPVKGGSERSHDFETRAKVMRAISDYMAENATILLVVTHEDFDLRYFVEKSYDFPELVGSSG